MHIVVSGKHIDIGESLRNHAIDAVSKGIKKFFENAIKANVIISKKNTEFFTTIVVNEGTGTHIVVKSDAHHDDPYRSLDKAIKRMELQLEKYSKRIKKHKKEKYNNLPLEAIKYIIPNFDDEEIDEGCEKAPTIIAESQLQILVLSVKDAVMHMDLRDVSGMLFIDAATMKLSMIYYRKDGNISWVDSGINMSCHM